MDRQFIKQLYQEHLHSRMLPAPDEVSRWMDCLLAWLFPAFSSKKFEHEPDFVVFGESLKSKLFSLLKKSCNSEDPAGQVDDFFGLLPDLRKRILDDAEAIYRGDPAARNVAEVIHSYPGFFAIAVHRIAHRFFDIGFPSLARMFAEYAHSKTGIDIHPAAKIGPRFCIDHGTGIVIGETTEIGQDVKIYQGVTLGALSVQKELAQTKRHPTIEDRVVIYAGATILGGHTIIGHDSIIGGNVWLVKSVPPHAKIYYTPAKSD